MRRIYLLLLLLGLVSYGGLCYGNGEESDLNKAEEGTPRDLYHSSCAFVQPEGIANLVSMVTSEVFVHMLSTCIY